MRVISQNGEKDIPYEKSYISISNKDNRQIIAFDTLVGDGYLIMAKYSKEEKAIKTMEMLRDEYSYFEKCKTKKAYADDEPTFCFKFPQDDEVEV